MHCQQKILISLFFLKHYFVAQPRTGSEYPFLLSSQIYTSTDYRQHTENCKFILLSSNQNPNQTQELRKRFELSQQVFSPPSAQ